MPRPRTSCGRVLSQRIFGFNAGDVAWLIAGIALVGTPALHSLSNNLGWTKAFDLNLGRKKVSKPMIAQPGPWQKLVGDLIKDLESQVPESPDFRTNIDHKLREYEHVAGRLPTGGIVETPERINAFRANVRSKVEHLLNEDPSNRVLRETLQLLDNPGIRIKPLVGEKRKA